MNEYTIKVADKAAAEQLMVDLGYEWDGSKHLTVTDERGRIDFVFLGDLPKQHPDGSIVIEEQTIDGEVVQIPIMVGAYHIDAISDYEVEVLNTVTPSNRLHNFAGVNS